MRIKFHKLKVVRAIVLPLLARLNPGDITIRHHFTGDPVRLHSYKHKGYWYHGAKREASTMAMFRRVLKKGDTVLEVGGHIGYISLFLKNLVGDGKVIVFEPGPNNLPYLEKNVQGKGIEVVRKAIGNEAAILPFFMDKRSGQNNSLVQDFFMRDHNDSFAFDSTSAGSTPVQVEVIPLDSFVSERGIVPDFIKIDIEGFELNALHGMVQTLRTNRPAVMVEVQMHNEKVATFLKDLGYLLFYPAGVPAPPAPSNNVFCLHKEKHLSIIQSLKP